MTEHEPRPAESLSPLARATAVVGLVATVGSLLLIAYGAIAQLTN